MYTDHALPSDSIMTVDTCDRRLVTYFEERVTSRSKIIIEYKEKEQRGRFGEIDEKISREEYTLDWSQSKVFLVIVKCGMKKWYKTAFSSSVYRSFTGLHKKNKVSK